MNILAFIIALFSSLLSFLQGGCATVLSGIGGGLSSEYGSRVDREFFAAAGGASFLVFLASFVGLTGGILAILKKKSAFTVLLVSAGMCGFAFAISKGTFADAGLYGILYLASAICAKAGYNKAECEILPKLQNMSSAPGWLGNINMRLTALGLGILGILLNLFQGVFNNYRGNLSLAEMLYIFVSDFHPIPSRNVPELLELFMVPLIMVILAIIGCKRLIQKRNGKIFLAIPVAFWTAIFLIVTFNGNSKVSIGIILTWAIIYGLSALCAWLNEKKSAKAKPVLPYTEERDAKSAVNLTKAAVPDNVSQEVKKTYEPVIGIETSALIKRAMLFLEDGEIYNAERYIEQAINQDPENPQVYMAKLMLEHRVKSPVELLNKLDTPLEDEKLFQRALRFAYGEYKSQLEGFAQASRDKLEQKHLTEEADKQAEREKLYQKILNLKRTASTTFDFEQLLRLINSLRPYKDTDEFYNEVNQVLQREKYYQSVVQNWQEAKTPDEIQSVINRLEKLNGYKDVDELLSEAREDLAKAKKQKLTKGISLTVALIALIWGGIAFLGSYHDAKRREEARLAEIAQIQKEQNMQNEYAQGENYLNAKNYSQALEIFRQLANQGHAPAQDKLGWMYQNGWGVTQDYSQAVSWFRKAAEQGNTEALASMGLMYLRGWGVQQSYDTAFEWYSKAAEQGSEVARKRMNSILLLTENMQKILSMKDSLESGHGFPLAGTIFAETLSVRQSPSTKAKSLTTLKTGHPVSISRVTDGDNDYWFYIKTASGTEGWVMMGYVKLVDRNLSYQETSNRNYSLPRIGHVTVSESSSFLNLRNIPSMRGSKVVDKLDDEQQITAYEVFAGDTIDWYKVRTNYGTEGWVSGKYIKIE